MQWASFALLCFHLHVLWHFSSFPLLSKTSLTETWCFSSINQEPVFFCLIDVRNSANWGLTCKLSCSVLAAKAEFTITRLQSSRSFLPLEMDVFSNCEQTAALLWNLSIFHQRGKDPRVFAFPPNLHISIIAFAFIINYSLWSVMLKLKSSHWCILQCFSSPLQVFHVEALCDWWKQDLFFFFFFFHFFSFLFFYSFLPLLDSPVLLFPVSHNMAPAFFVILRGRNCTLTQIRNLT